MTVTDRAIPLLSDEELAVATPEERHSYAAFLQRQLWVSDPVQWASDRLGERFWSKQADVAYAVRDHSMVAVKSCHDVGKSFVVSRLAGWWIDTHSPGDAFVVTSAPSFSQVRGILWREIGIAHRKGHLPGRVNLTEWFLGNQLVGFGRKPDDTDPTAFQGIHAKYVLVILDEACGIPQQLWDAASTLVTNEHSRIVAIGNPDDPQSHFARVCRSDTWHTITISAFDSPRFTGETVSAHLEDLLISPSWVERHKAEWGEESPIFTSKVLGEFPEDNSDGVVPWSWAKSCQQVDRDHLDIAGPVELGIDVGAGGDETVLRERIGMRAGGTWRFRHPDAMRTVGEIVNVIREIGALSVKVDVIGIGFGIHGRLAEMAEQKIIDCEVLAVNVGERSAQPSRFVNLKAELWWEIGREYSRQQTWDLDTVDDQTLSEMTAHRYSYDSSGRVKIEGKDEVRARLGRSPDNADALLLAYYRPAQTGPQFLGVA